MKTMGYVMAAALSLAIAAPSLASAETVVIKDGRRGAYADMHRDHGWRRDRGWHRHHDWDRHHDRVVIIKKRHHHW